MLFLYLGCGKLTMRKLFLPILILLLASSLANADGVIKRRVGASCSTQSFDVQNTGGATNTEVFITEQYAQSFKPGVTGDLYSISFEVGTAGAGATIEVRVGTSANLTTYLVQKASCAVPAGIGYFECVFSTYPTLTSGTTYYVGYQSTAGCIMKEGSATYADGQEFYEATTDWDLTGSGNAWDLNFKTKMCD